MEELCVAELFKATAPFCSSTVFESKPDNDVSAPKLEMHSEMEDVLGKRKVVEGLGEIVRRKANADSETLQILRECFSLVGRLQLCNKRCHSWGGLSAAGDCLAFTDSTASVCCSISRGLDVSIVGKLVRVSSWSFIPVNESRGFTKSSTGQCTKRPLTTIPVFRSINLKGRSDFHSVDSQDRGSKTVLGGAFKIGADIGDERSDAVDGSGFLEIHSLELLEKGDMKMETFPSVCVDPAAADIRNALFESPLIKKEDKRSRFTICGKLQSISPQFSHPCSYTGDRDDAKGSSEFPASSQDNRQKSNPLIMIGFLVELNFCHSCSCDYIDSWAMGVKMENSRARQLFGDGQLRHGTYSKHGVDQDHHDVKFDKRNSLHIYFSRSLAAWRPILSGSLKQCLVLSGLRRKLVLTGVVKNYQFLLVATRTSLIFPVLNEHHRNVRKQSENRNSERGRLEGGCAVQYARFTRNFELISARTSSSHPRILSYAGFVTSILFQGTLVELDKRVWLLLTHQGKSQLHGLRVGAMLAVRDVHAITIHNPSERALLLGACMRSHVSVVLFSPLDSPPFNKLHSPGLLLKYLQKVSFGSAFWILSLIGSFRQKFRGIHSVKVLMGSKKDPGIILKYIQKVFAPDDTLEGEDYFKEFFDHQHFSCSGGGVASVSLTKVPPISNFCQDIEASLQCPRSKSWLYRTGGSTDFQRWLEKKKLLSSLDISLESLQFAHPIITSQELGVTLLGSLQVCKKSGQLQLMDATGFVYVVVPDLLSSTHISKTYQVSSFTVMVKELTKDSTVTGDGRFDGREDSSISWSSMLKNSKAVVPTSQASELLVHFYLREAILVDTLSFCEGKWEGSTQGWKRRRLDEEHTKETGNMMELDLETVSTWLKQRMSELESVGNRTSDLKLLCDSSGGLNLPNELFRVSCKVVAIDLLVFECQVPMLSKNRPSSDSPSGSNLELDDDDWLFPLGIPLTLASVVIDDGCGLAHCWALGDAAVSLLGPLKASVQSELPPNLLSRLSEKYVRSDMQFTMMEFMCCLVRRHGKVVLRSERPYGAAFDTLYALQWCGRYSPDCDDQAFMQAVVARACNNYSLVVTLGKIPPTVKDGPESSKSPLECCRTLAYRTGFRRSRVQDEWPHLFAAKVEPTVLLSDVRAVSDEIASLLENEL